MTDVTSLDAFGHSSVRIQHKGEMYLLVFIVIFGLLGLALCLGLFGRVDSNASTGISQVELVHEGNHRSS